MAGKKFTPITMLEARFSHFPKRFDCNGVTRTVKSVIQSWTVNTGTNPHFRFFVVLDDYSQANIYRFIKDGTLSGDLWKLDVTAKVEA